MSEEKALIAVGRMILSNFSAALEYRKGDRSAPLQACPCCGTLCHANNALHSGLCPMAVLLGAGTFTLTSGGQTTPPIPHLASPAQIQHALDKLK